MMPTQKLKIYPAEIVYFCDIFVNNLQALFKNIILSAHTGAYPKKKVDSKCKQKIRLCSIHLRTIYHTVDTVRSDYFFNNQQLWHSWSTHMISTNSITKTGIYKMYTKLTSYAKNTYIESVRADGVWMTIKPVLTTAFRQDTGWLLLRGIFTLFQTVRTFHFIRVNKMIVYFVYRSRFDLPAA